VGLLSSDCLLRLTQVDFEIRATPLIDFGQFRASQAPAFTVILLIAHTTASCVLCIWYTLYAEGSFCPYDVARLALGVVIVSLFAQMYRCTRLALRHEESSGGGGGGKGGLMGKLTGSIDVGWNSRFGGRAWPLTGSKGESLVTPYTRGSVSLSRGVGR